LPAEFEIFWATTHAERIAMINSWQKEILDADVQTFIGLVEEFISLAEERKAIREQQDLEILMEARVIGATTTGAARYKDLLLAKRPGILIVEEAGEVLEAHILSALEASSTKHLILIGDHMQLRPKVESYKLTTVSRTGYDLDCSLFERLVTSSLPSVTLGVQHRMRPEISEFIRMQTYPTLMDHESVKTFPHVMGVRKNVVFIDHSVPEDHEDNIDEDAPTKSKSNRHEVEMCVEIARFFLLQGYSTGSITILTPYLGQLLQIVKLVKSRLKEATAILSESDTRELDAT
jgi:superfamily I DNA and/or RNA helicase